MRYGYNLRRYGDLLSLHLPIKIIHNEIYKRTNKTHIGLLFLAAALTSFHWVMMDQSVKRLATFQTTGVCFPEGLYSSPSRTDLS
jgi:hypothetical protein